MKFKDEVAQASLSDASWMSLESWSRHVPLDGGPTLEGLCASAGLGALWGSPGRTGGYLYGEGGSGHLWFNCCAWFVLTTLDVSVATKQLQWSWPGQGSCFRKLQLGIDGGTMATGHLSHPVSICPVSGLWSQNPLSLSAKSLWA